MPVSQSGTHRALLVDEIYLNIIRRLDDRSLSHLAGSCRGLSEPALDLLWESLDSLLPLVTMLPRGIVRRKPDHSHPAYKPWRSLQPFNFEVGPLHQSGFGRRSVQRRPDGGYKTSQVDQSKRAARGKLEVLVLPVVHELKRPPTEEQWERILSYTGRVKHLRHDPSDTKPHSERSPRGLDRISPAFLMALLNPPGRRPLFSKLESVYWNDSDPETFLFLEVLKRSSILSLDITGVRCGDSVDIRTRRNVLKVLTELGDLSPSLQSLRVRLGDDAPFSFRSMAKTICSMHNLTSVEYDLYEVGALRHLAGLPALWRAEIHMHTGTTRLPRDGLAGPAFPSLQTLVLHGGHQEVSEFFRFVKGPSSVRNLSIDLSSSSDPPPLSTVLEAIATHCDPHCLESLQLQETVAPELMIHQRHDLRISEETLKDALRFKTLKHFILDTCRAISLSDDSMRRISLSWKSLETFEINRSSGRWYADADSRFQQATIRGLHLLVKSLPHLSRLAVAIDGRTITRKHHTSPTPTHVLRRLNLLDSQFGGRIGSEDVVICLSGMIDMPESWRTEKARLRVDKLRLTEPQLADVLQGKGKKKWEDIRNVIVENYNNILFS
ncbi:hypothetical protein CONPUDRAFT_164355 [Coniophora puteana RWD-64-598 SS2]|uniref:F-box domain-containing protein n=1 Tax=Coniophora puteana (strain RWD-64-598) TaxID=741705 RepID=A0A5M3MWN0_CONPW|nr:uncharacterized protein CONPUDRAFT_164355 [Coniophora puteana RWD-64-598 SS2]EIW83397.1 hypothetical protein CONPUDRAFT_164355 [Coniophora puteana RWD-64-598 SS2]